MLGARARCDIKRRPRELAGWLATSSEQRSLFLSISIADDINLISCFVYMTLSGLFSCPFCSLDIDLAGFSLIGWRQSILAYSRFALTWQSNESELERSCVATHRAAAATKITTTILERRDRVCLFANSTQNINLVVVCVRISKQANIMSSANKCSSFYVINRPRLQWRCNEFVAAAFGKSARI